MPLFPSRLDLCVAFQSTRVLKTEISKSDNIDYLSFSENVAN